ncbi:MAG: hypothetical protein J6U68_03775 [Clostridia bacterium]|nr:hypothetical protein [Clostridia bacterium]
MNTTYYRSQGYRYPQEIHVPSNYGGSAFSSEEETHEPKESAIEATAEELEVEEEKPRKDAPASLFKSLSPPSLLGGKIGTEELLILAVILIISDSEGSGDIIWILLLLLFVK